jgi:hypothetical protein
VTIEEQSAAEPVEQTEKRFVDRSVERPVRLGQPLFQLVPPDRLAP